MTNHNRIDSDNRHHTGEYLWEKERSWERTSLAISCSLRWAALFGLVHGAVFALVEPV